MKIELYKINTLSNLHVGSGDINFDIIDNQVQRDAITNLPNINSSSLKGAFREVFSSENGSKALVEYIFGPDNISNDSHQTGAYSFFEAQILTRPVRSNVKAYFNATSPLVIQNFLETIENFNIDFDAETKKVLQRFADLKVQKSSPLIFQNIKNAILEDDKATVSNFDTTVLEKFLGKNLALFDDADFKQLELPVLARNALENGISQNLWYEEVVPKKTQFFFCIAKPDNIDEKDAKKIAGFENRFHNEGSIVQFGANKSIGYGFSKVTRIS
ncbi:type III-B CRISPR module RAMP protein Cmr4 [Sulfurimonas sp. NWX367]|uniref:type III-B CRISPR module RAMP protein Cmr4 n=1 Tax=unclassified Sulfurimonas TaxID=2623549 RepID=UPI003204F004